MQIFILQFKCFVNKQCLLKMRMKPETLGDFECAFGWNENGTTAKHNGKPSK